MSTDTLHLKTLATEANTEGQARPFFPMPLRIGFVVVALITGGYALYQLTRDRVPDSKPPQITLFPQRMATQWPDIYLSVDAVARLDQDMVVAEWSYFHSGETIEDPFAWGHQQPNWFAQAVLIDGDGNRHPVALAEDGVPIAADSNRNDDSGWSRPIYPGTTLPAWARFEIPAGAAKPFRFLVHGVLDPDGVAVPVLTPAEQAARSRQARETVWPEVYIQLREVRREGQAVVVQWNYENRGAQPFRWDADDPNFIAMTRLFDFANGAEIALPAEPGACNSIHDASGQPRTIAPGATFGAHARFEGVVGDQVELIFHGAISVFVGDRIQ